MRTTSWVKKGAVWQWETDSTALLTPQTPTSFLADFDYSVNPLAGYPFSCDDCYVPALPTVQFRRDVLPDGQRTSTAATWGSWVEVRTRSVGVLRHAIDQGKLDGATLFMSPVSDVYWPGEREHRLTQALFSRQNPSLAQRFRAAHELVASGIPTRIHVAPLQPHTSAFAERLADAAHWIWLDWHIHPEAGFPALYAAHGWHPSSPEDVAAFAEQLGGYTESRPWLLWHRKRANLPPPKGQEWTRM